MDREQFHIGRKICQRNGIYITGNDGSVCLTLMFNTHNLLHFLNTSEGSGLKRIQKLAKLLNHEGLGGIDMKGQAIIEWCEENKYLFEDIENEVHRNRILSDVVVYLNHYGKEIDTDMNNYVKNDAGYSEEEWTQSTKYGDDLMWFWCGEF